MNSLWHRHPAVRSGNQLTLGERAADVMRNSMGSWAFVFSFLGFMALWAMMNVVALVAHWDPYPFILLNLFLSMLAGLQGAILLIAAKRADQVSSELALHTFENTQKLTEVLTHVDTLTTAVHQHILEGKD